MVTELSKKLGTMEQDNLISDLDPRVVIGVCTIRKETKEEKVYKRGTLLAVDSTDKLCVMMEKGKENLKPFAILCDDTTVGTDENVTTSVYLNGCFDPKHIIAGEGYTLTVDDLYELRKCGIIFKSALPATSKEEEE